MRDVEFWLSCFIQIYIYTQFYKQIKKGTYIQAACDIGIFNISLLRLYFILMIADLLI